MSTGRLLLTTKFWQSLNISHDYERNEALGEMKLSPAEPWNLFDQHWENQTLEHSNSTAVRDHFEERPLISRTWSSTSSDSDYCSGEYTGGTFSPSCDQTQTPANKEGMDAIENQSNSDHMVQVMSHCHTALIDIQWDRKFVEKLIGVPSRGQEIEEKTFYAEIQKNDILDMITWSKLELRAFHSLINYADRSNPYFNLIQLLKSNFIKDENHSRDYYSHLNYSWDQDNQLLKSWETNQGLIYRYVSASTGSSRETKLTWLNPILENLAKIILQVRLNLWKVLSTFNYEAVPVKFMEMTNVGIMKSIKLPYRATDPVQLPDCRFPPSRKPIKYIAGYPQYNVSNTQRELRKSF